MVRFTLVQISYVSAVFLLASEWQFALFVLLAGLVGSATAGDYQLHRALWPAARKDE
jgi:hypothetical protein